MSINSKEGRKFARKKKPPIILPCGFNGSKNEDKKKMEEKKEKKYR